MVTDNFVEAVRTKHPALIAGIDFYFEVVDGEAVLSKWPEVLDQPTTAGIEDAAVRLERQKYIAALEARYDLVARQRRYDDRKTCALRAGYAGPFQVEGTAFAIWMDEQNVYAYAQLDAVLAGEREKPTPDELVAELAPMVWPE